MTLRSTSLLCGLLAVVPAFAAQAGSIFRDLTWSATGAGAWVENLSRSSNPLDMREAMAYDSTFNAAGSRQLARNWLLGYSAEAGYHAIPEFSHNNLLTYGVRGRLQRKFGLGPLVPALTAQAGYRQTDARINAQDGGTLSASLHLSKRLLSSVRVGLDAAWLQHDARHATYDIQQHTFSIEAEWDITDRWRLSGSVGRLSGDIVATAGPTVWNRAITGLLGPAIGTYYNSTPWEVTDAYGPGWVSYQVKADVDLWSLALTHSFSANTSIDLRLSSAYAVNIVNVRYLQRHWGAGFNHRF